jgi:hypothetical protein
MRMCGRTFRFKEPDAIRNGGCKIVFVYGDAPGKDVSDKLLFKEMRQGQFRETVNDTIARIDPMQAKEQRFELGSRKSSRKKPFLMRGIQADAFLTGVA